MKTFAAGCQLALTLSLFSLSVFGQMTQSCPECLRDPKDEPRSLGQPDPWKTQNELQNLRVSGVKVDGRAEPRVLSKGPLAPPVEDRNSFGSFLQDKHTGLVRLMPREIYDSVISHTKETIKIRGGGAYYSFANLTHVYGYGSDIELNHDMLSVGFAGADYGILTNLGNIPLDDLTLADPRTSALAHYQVATSESQARAARMRLQQGVVINGDLYHSRVPVEVNATYLLRSISFIGGTDVLVTFRVVRRDTDGSIIILWKLLKQYSYRR
jgi:hypothetical protein